MRKSLFIFLIALPFIIGNCDKIDNPVIPVTNQYLENLYGPPPTFTPETAPWRHVLFVEFTGHVCGFCPPATAQLNAWNEQYGDSLVTFAVHAGTLAEPGNEPFQRDFRTPLGNTLWSNINGGFNPGALMNQYPSISGFELIGAATWASSLSAAFTQPVKLGVQLKASYNSEYKHLNVHAFGNATQNISGNLSLVILITESDIVSPQEDYSQTPNEILDYVHNHVLRAGISNATGDPISNGLSAGDQFEKSYTVKWNDSWNISNSHVIAFVVDQSGSVLNAIQAHIE
jgi:hypothetical protein